MKDLLKICIISGYPPNKGRGAEFTSAFINILSRAVEVRAITILGNIAEETPVCEEKGNIRIIRCWKPSSIVYLIKTLRVMKREACHIINIYYGYLFFGTPFFHRYFY